jgi:tRNA threonylcarbamoyladenosine biosynthesis protein TsaE
MLAPTAQDMMNLGTHFAREASAGAVFALIGDLGAGKTHWTKGFVHGIGSPADVTSPTFGLLHEYPGGRLPIHHLDFYRMASADEVIALGWDELLDQDAILIAEWADRFPELFPIQTRWLHFSIAGDGTRILSESPSVKAPTQPLPLP